MRKPIVVTTIGLLLTCCGTAGNQLDNATGLPPLPYLHKYPCCWQAEEQLTLFHAEENRMLHSVVEVRPSELVLVVLDVLGRQVLTLTYRNEAGKKKLIETHTPENWDKRYSHYLMVAILLHYSEAGSWLEQDADWSVKHEGLEKTLSFRGKPQVVVSYTGSEKNSRNISFPGQNLVRQTLLKVSTLLKQSI